MAESAFCSYLMDGWTLAALDYTGDERGFWDQLWAPLMDYFRAERLGI